MSSSFPSLLADTIKQNEIFLSSNLLIKDGFFEIIELMNDAIDFMPKDDHDLKDPWTEFVLNGMFPLSYGIYSGILCGNTIILHMQLRLLLEYFVLTMSAEKISGDHLLEKFEQARLDYNGKRISDIIREFDTEIYHMWKKASEWHHAKSYSHKVEQITINEKAKLWSVIQPAIYSEEDIPELTDFFDEIKKFRNALDKHTHNKKSNREQQTLTDQKQLNLHGDS